MLFQKLIWAALTTAVVVGSLQTGVQRWQAAPLILAAEVYEDQKADVHKAEVSPPAGSLPAHAHGDGEAATAHDHGDAEAWAPENGVERTGWTWIANMLHALSMALLVFATMGVWFARRGTSSLTASAPLRVAGLVAAAGWLSFHLWPTLGLPAEVPGMDAAPLQARQIWWVLAVGCSAGACAIAAFVRSPRRWLAAAALLVLPFVVGAPQLQGDALAGFGPEAHAALERLGHQFILATTLVALSFWLCMGLVGGLAFQRWVAPGLRAALSGKNTAASGAMNPVD